ncbi:glycosyltransferase family 2 protein [Candidatus Parcubacteria bacterium]|nr:glycosyltransferase family 2 protein [Candidatus Parcubacteria bacterium]
MPSSALPRLSVVIPAYNEAKRITATLLDVDHYLSRQGYAYEILVMNDGSTDNTVEVVRRFEGTIAHLRLIDNSENNGKGYVVRRGMLESRGAVRLFTDADNSTSIDHIEQFWPYFDEGYDIVIGSRAVRGAKIAVHQSLLKELAGRLGNKYIQIMAVWGIKDTQAGFKAFTAEAARDIFSRLTINRWGFDVETLAVARLLSYRIREMPIRWVNAVASHVRVSAYLEVLWETTKIRFNIWRGKYTKSLKV